MFAMLTHFKVHASWTEILKRTAKRAIDDDILGLSAQLAFYFFLALFPALLFVVALASYFPLDNLIQTLVNRLSGVAPPDIIAIIEEQLRNISQQRQGGLLTIGILGALWSASAAMVAIMGALNRAFEIDEGRPWWKARLVAIGLTVGTVLFLLLATVVVLLGPRLGEWMAGWVGLGDAFALAWQILQWPIVFILVSLAISLIYYLAPDAEQGWVWISPGSLLATTVWLLGSLGFRFYVASFGEYNETYGAIGGIIVMLLWLYLSALAIMIGAELSATIEQASPHGKEAGEKVPGEKRKLGALAAQEHEKRSTGDDGQEGRGRERRGEREGRDERVSAGSAPVAAPVLARRYDAPRSRPRLAELVIGGLVLATEFFLLVRSRLRRVKD
jgi:membrane protein